MSTRPNARLSLKQLSIFATLLAGIITIFAGKGKLDSIVIQICGNGSVEADNIICSASQSIPSPSSTPSIPSSSNPTSSAPSPNEGKFLQELGRSEYLAFINEAKSVVASMPPNQPLKFPLGVNRPIRTGSQVGSSQIIENFAIGYIDKSSGKAKLIVPSDLAEMFERPDAIYGDSDQLNASGHLPKPKTQLVMVTNVAGQLHQEKCGKNTIDLIIFNVLDGNPYIAPCVDLTDIYRDALNAALNRDLTINVYGIDISVLNQ